MGARTFTVDELDEIGVPYECGAFGGTATELHREQTDARRWYSVHELVFRAPDDGKAYRVYYERGLTEHQDDHGPWEYGATVVHADEVAPHAKTVTEWRAVVTGE